MQIKCVENGSSRGHVQLHRESKFRREMYHVNGTHEYTRDESGLAAESHKLTRRWKPCSLVHMYNT